MAEVTNYCFKYAIELNTIIDEYKGECSLEHLNEIEPKTYSNLNSIVSKINNSIRYVLEKYGDVSCLLYTSPSPRDGLLSRMPSSA